MCIKRRMLNDRIRLSYIRETQFSDGMEEYNRVVEHWYIAFGTRVPYCPKQCISSVRNLRMDTVHCVESVGLTQGELQLMKRR